MVGLFEDEGEVLVVRVVSVRQLFCVLTLVGVGLAGYASVAEYGIDGALTYLFSTHCDCSIAL